MAHGRIHAHFLSRILGTLALGAWLASSPAAQAATDLLISALPAGTHPTGGIVPGQTVVNIEMAVFNQGANADPAATVSFPLTAFCTNITWTCTTLGGSTCTASGTTSINDVVNLPASSIVDYNIQCTVIPSATPASVAQAMTVTASLGDTDSSNNSFIYSVGVTPQADVAITKNDGVGTATPGGSVTYTITATNAGPSDSPNSNIYDPFPGVLTVTWTCTPAGGATCSPGGSGVINDTVNLPAGSSITYTAAGTIDPAATGTLSNTANATASVTDTDTTNNAATDTDTLVPQADLAITKTDGVTTATPGGSVTYTITASNAGPSNAPGATVTDALPASLTAVTWTCVGAGGGTCGAPSGSGNISDTVNLPAGGSVTYTVSATVSAAATGSMSNTATVTAPAGVTDPTPGNNSATDTDTLAPNADLAITLTDGVTAAAPGGNVTYTITASNAGPSNIVGATVADAFPASLTVTWACTGAGGGTCTGSGTGNINDTVNLPVGASVTYTASASVSAAATGTLSNTASVAVPAGATDPNPGNNSATDTDSLSVVTFSGPSATGTGTITAHIAGPASCTFSSPQFIGPPPGSPPIPPTAPAGGVAFPEGLFDFSVTGCTVGATITLTIVYPQPLPPGTRYWKYGPTSSNHTPHWYTMPATITSNTVTLSITDGGLGDDDFTANGVMSDPGGPGVGTFLVPTLDVRSLALLVLLLLAGAAWTMRRRRGDVPG